MKEEINLLPPVVKKKRTYRLYLRRWKRLYWVVCIGLLMIGSTYGTMYRSMQQSAERLDGEMALHDTEDRQVEQNIRDANRMLREINQRSRAYQQWSVLAQDVLQAVPAGVYLTNIALKDAPDPALFVSGQSNSRTAIVEYERRLKALPWIEAVEAPLQNLASGAEVRFSFTLFRANNSNTP